ncbi:MAG: hypothetical protein SFV54_02800 [Bryobacteraceae bacterium]|nr:hypothetical protein [Bryobacteraceae bacterium]
MESEQQRDPLGLAEHVAPHATHTPGLEVFVLFTDVPSTYGALRAAMQLCEGLAARVRLLMVHEVPYPAPIDKPPQNLAFLRARFQALIGRCTEEVNCPEVEAKAEIVLCRDGWKTLENKLSDESVVVIGRRSGWWPHREDRWARRLRRAGHHVVRTSCGGGTENG